MSARCEKCGGERSPASGACWCAPNESDAAALREVINFQREFQDEFRWFDHPVMEPPPKGARMKCPKCSTETMPVFEKDGKWHGFSICRPCNEARGVQFNDRPAR